MMKHRYIVSILALFLFAGSLFGKPVTLAEVREAVNALVQSWGKQMDIGAIEGRYLADGALGYYMVDLKQGGWVMVSADDVMRPVLAFSFENSLTPENEWNDAARYLLSQYKEEISVAIRNTSLLRNVAWDREAQASAKKATAAAPVEPFITVNWNQSSGWNMFCPEDEDGPGGHAYVGCVAVAMAQAMSVYEYPVQPQGVKDYVHPDYGSLAVNYNLADPYAWGQMSASGADEYNAMLLYHCAIAVEMDFGPDGSGAFVRDANAALKRYFNYPQSMTFAYRYDDTDEWVSTLAAELEAGRPIIYRGNPGDGTAGHAWNLDGYYSSGTVDYFHMNFGWSGSQNGYYTLDNITPGSNDFNANQGAILGMAPPASMPYDLALSEESVLEELPDSSFVADVLVTDEDPDNIYNFTCKGPFSVLLDDYGPASFYIEDQKLYTKEVFEYNDSDPNKNSVFLLIIVEDQYGNEYQEQFSIAIEKVFHGPTGIALSDSSVMEGRPAGTAVAKLIIEDEDPLNTYTYMVEGPFFIENDTLKTTTVFDYATSDSSPLTITVEDSRGFILSRGFTIEILQNQSGTTGIREQTRGLSIYPNPADQFIFLEGLEKYESIELWELSGKMLLKVPGEHKQLDVSGFKNGIYLLVFNGSGERLVRKVLIQH